MAVRRPSEPLYHAVALGTTAYVRAAFRVHVLRADRASVAGGSLLVSTHRAETDAPLLIYALYRYADVWRSRSQRVSFAARQDLFEPGFFGGFPERMPEPVRRMLFRIGIGRWLPLVRVHPIRSAHAMPLAAALRRLPPDHPVVRDFAHASPRELWRFVGPSELPAADLWAQWAAAAKEDVRRLVDVIRAGESLLLFPEGRPSPDGGIGPLRRGVELLVRRGRPEVLRPIGIAYDPFVHGRMRAFVSFGEPVGPDADVLDALRLATPLTCASAVAHAFVRGEEPEAALERAVAEALDEGRNVEPALLRTASRRERLRECLAHVDRRDRRVERLAREYASATSRER